MKLYALLALVAMLCLAGLASAQTSASVGGSIQKSLGSSSATSITGLDLVPGTAVESSFTVSGEANADVQLSVSGSQDVLYLLAGDPPAPTATSLTNPMTISPETNIVTPTLGSWSQVFEIDQPVSYGDPVGSYLGTITVTVQLAAT